MTNQMWESQYKSAYLSTKISEEENVAERNAKDALDTIIRNETETEREKLGKSKFLAEATRKQVAKELQSAASRNRVLYNVKEKEDDTTIKQNSKRAASLKGLESAPLYVKFLSNEITFEKLAEELGKIDEEKIQSRAYTDDLRNPQQYRKGYKPPFEDNREDGDSAR